ncbi:MAG: FAD-binding oxidoreductase [Spirochaetes bacterium]|nr:MAG: FAD-binding oxidoreductase [Spirochaetota bacterium]
MPNKTHLLRQLENISGKDNVLSSPEVLKPYSHDESATDEFNTMPVAVVKPESTEQVAEIVRLCAEEGVPITPRGAGTGLAGGCIPVEEGIVLSLERLNRRIHIDPENMSVTADAGISLKQLYQVVEEGDLFFPPHPGDESAMLGGIVAANAGGARAVKYGTVKHFVRGLKVVTADGKILSLGGNLMKSSTGYHLMDLMIGSEGTLGIITEVTLSLLPKPGTIMTMVAPFKTVDEAISSVLPVLNLKIIPFAVEFIEHSTIRCVERLLNKNWPVKSGTASLLIILDGPDEDRVLETAEKIGKELENHGALDILIAEQREKQAEILELRSMIYEALRPGVGELYDVCVPRSEIGGHVQFIHELEERIGVPLPTIGHAADGNLHSHAMKYRLEDGEMKEPIKDFAEKNSLLEREIFADVFKRGGVISGEHGIGIIKKNHLIANLGKDAVDMMKAIKQALDPNGILNPGKLF